mmetsp:Transcript_20667/g.62280  ORF Transcript_20667/g.62280 Transcript_20667/m.62280 type:complete len:473 (+) Transcript_20667:213-1631(+)|eukprot:CAMPEP_0206149646 /NCGR_PEP_ID=MMETSP1473-20131121/37892_1 /ASSEMBLY_ACC=CAM_ASM_001109 /TAXON_ID=1461547 /ORGANISM="Stichococcus sp, Strain RCC1054" /LENGTH=472 /DNA_ID=CAMNT_0053547125 /DNA_START=659 /DNA_END=2077 /DNA_ORIENTATION=-
MASTLLQCGARCHLGGSLRADGLVRPPSTRSTRVCAARPAHHPSGAPLRPPRQTPKAVADTGAAPVLESDSSLDEADSIDPSLLASLDESLLAANDDFREAALLSAAVSVDEDELRARIHNVARTGLQSVDGSSDDEDSQHWQIHQATARAAKAVPVEVVQGEAEVSEERGLFGMSKAVEGMILLNVGAALFGSNMVAIKAAEDSMSSTALSATRFAIAALAFTPYVIRGLKLPHVRKNAAELALWLFGGYTAQAYGLEMTTAARGAFTSTFTVVAVPLLVGLSGRRVAWTTWASAVVALIGVGMLTSSGGDPTWGDALCIASAVLFGVHKWRSESVTAEVAETTELIAVQLAALAVASAVLTVPEVLGDIQVESTAQLWASFAGLPWPALLFMGLGTTALTLAIEMNALKHVSSPVAAIIYTAEPLWGAGLAYAILGERWGALGWVGATLIIGSSLAAQLADNKSSKAKAE